jgi:hypothetical protein
VFFAFLLLGGWRLLPLVFGPRFDQYRDLIPPNAVFQTFSAAGVGFLILIKVQQRGRFLLLSRLVVTVFGLGVVTLGAAEYGLTGAVWGIAVASLLSTAWVAFGALREQGAAVSIPVQASEAVIEAEMDRLSTPGED